MIEAAVVIMKSGRLRQRGPFRVELRHAPALRSLPSEHGTPSTSIPRLCRTTFYQRRHWCVGQLFNTRCYLHSGISTTTPLGHDLFSDVLIGVRNPAATQGKDQLVHGGDILGEGMCGKETDCCDGEQEEKHDASEQL
ncbi:hypothetical protein E6O75_ATG07578 [Venturia nashicola]|uniref:Uncharacterized protein n=1 Tax=Venturia nashicola TaxID=86259 RepID=A0A4Z1PF76_9PEZI|nr:hypothetical protein E6O75_ATG07578 [Venturia nashicola]